MEKTSVLRVNDKYQKQISRLIKKSRQEGVDFETALPWDRGVDKNKYPKLLEHNWLAGTNYIDHLNPAHLLELSWLEIGRDVSSFIWLERTLPPLYLGYINHSHGQMDKDIEEYLMIFSGEEITHTLAFNRYMADAGLSLWKPPRGLHQLLTEVLPTMDPHFGVFFTLILEWVAEMGALYTTQNDHVDPLTKSLFYHHHLDEARHIAFGRWISESFFASASEKQMTQLKQMTATILPSLINLYTFNPEISDYTTFLYPVDRDDYDVIDRIHSSDYWHRINQERFGDLFQWLRRYEII